MSDNTLRLTTSDRDNYEIHYQCGGRLIPMSDPEWLTRQPHNTVYQQVELARCDRCGLPGEVFWVNA